MLWARSTRIGVFRFLFHIVEFSVFHYFRYQVRGCVIFAESFISVMALGRPKDNYLRKSLFDNLVGIFTSFLVCILKLISRQKHLKGFDSWLFAVSTQSTRETRILTDLGGTGKSLSEALLFAERGENMLCTDIVLNVKNNFCTQRVLPMFWAWNFHALNL